VRHETEEFAYVVSGRGIATVNGHRATRIESRCGAAGFPGDFRRLLRSLACSPPARRSRLPRSA
jgi:hypothetical protein